MNELNQSMCDKETDYLTLAKKRYLQFMEAYIELTDIVQDVAMGNTDPTETTVMPTWLDIYKRLGLLQAHAAQIRNFVRLNETKPRTGG